MSYKQQTEGDSTMIPKYPHINIPMVGEDGNAFSILGRCYRIMGQNGLADRIEEFTMEATAGDYDALLATVMMWFAVDEQLSYEDDEWSHNWYGDQHDEEDDEEEE